MIYRPLEQTFRSVSHTYPERLQVGSSKGSSCLGLSYLSSAVFEVLLIPVCSVNMRNDKCPCYSVPCRPQDGDWQGPVPPSPAFLEVQRKPWVDHWAICAYFRRLSCGHHHLVCSCYQEPETPASGDWMRSNTSHVLIDAVFWCYVLACFFYWSAICRPRIRFHLRRTSKYP